MRRAIRITLFFLACFALTVAFFFGYQSNSAQVSESSRVEIGGSIVNVAIADTPESREQGLSGRPGLAANEGMLFVFPKDGRYAFWMKDMQFAIDITWISYSKEIVDIRESVGPESLW